MYKPHTTCRACGSTNLTSVMDLGLMPMANDFHTQTGPRQGYAPLEVMFCEQCSLGQLSVVVNPAILYEEYPYVTSHSDVMKKHFELLFRTISDRWPIANVMEIGSNDGAFLDFCRDLGSERVVGCDPATNLTLISTKKGIQTINGLFDHYNAEILHGAMPVPDVVFARHVLGHIDDWQELLGNLSIVCARETIVAIEVPTTSDLLVNVGFDQIYHEHLSYVTDQSIIELLKGSCFTLAGIHHFEVHHGSTVYLLRRKDFSHTWDHALVSTDRVTADDWTMMAVKANEQCDLFRSFLRNAFRDRKVVCGYGASAKGSVWLNYCQPETSVVRFLIDETPAKQGKLCPGIEVPVCPESALAEADYAILFAHNYADEIMAKHPDWKGRWVIPVPEVKVIENAGIHAATNR